MKQVAAAFALGLMIYAAQGMGGGELTSVTGAGSPAAIPEAAQGADPKAPRKVKENVVAYHTADQAMNAAKLMARQTLPRFAKMWEDGVAGTYTAKFPLTQNGQTEHIWLQVDGFNGEMINGRLSNEPVNGNKYKMGQRMQIAQAAVEDWMVNQGDAIYGGYTARVALSQMPDGERVRYEKLFKD